MYVHKRKIARAPGKCGTSPFATDTMQPNTIEDIKIRWMLKKNIRDP